MVDNKELLAKLNKIEDKLDNLDGRVDNIDITLAKQHVSLEYHIKRSDQADAAIKIVSDELSPVKDHVKAVNTLIKVLAWSIGIVGTLVGIMAGITALIK